MPRIYYRDGYKYQLTRECSLDLGHGAPFDIVTEWIDYSADGNLTIRPGYAWDGPSGPTVDTPDSMRASLVHDALYQLMRERLLNPAFYRETADKILRRLCIEDGMPELRADAWYEGVRLFAAGAADPKNVKKEKSAP